jgi:hypothetical protein
MSCVKSSLLWRKTQAHVQSLWKSVPNSLLFNVLLSAAPLLTGIRITSPHVYFGRLHNDLLYEPDALTPNLEAGNGIFKPVLSHKELLTPGHQGIPG